MDDSSGTFQEKIIEFVKHNIFVVALFFGGLTFLGAGLVEMMGPKNPGSGASDFQSTAEVAGAATQSSDSAKIKVDVEGQVVDPGVYDIDINSRVQDALIAAGGLSSNADRNIIEKTLNLAQKLVDGQKIYVPSKDDATSGVVGVSSGNSGSSNTSISTNGGLVSINSGTEQDLDSLPGVGPVTAQKIISNRPYGSLQDLVNKKAVGNAVFEKIKDLISL